MGQSARPRTDHAVSRKRGNRRPYRLQQVPVARIRPEDGLGRQRDRDGHRELCRSIQQFGVLTPITVRAAPDGSGDWLLVKGQGRTLACRLLGLEFIPALVLREDYAETEKVQQFLVENVARLRMTPTDRALLISRARGEGEETMLVAKRFGVSPATVRRLEAQLHGASRGEVAALRAGDLNLALHAVITKHVAVEEREAVVDLISPYGMRAKEMEILLLALDWPTLVALGASYRVQRLRLLSWACETLASLPRSDPRERIRQMALQLPCSLKETKAVDARVS